MAGTLWTLARRTHERKEDNHDFNGHVPLELYLSPEVCNSDPGSIDGSSTTGMRVPNWLFLVAQEEWSWIIDKERAEDALYSAQDNAEDSMIWWGHWEITIAGDKVETSEYEAGAQHQPAVS